MSNSKKDIIVLGAGVEGLTAALHLQQSGRYQVTIVAAILPTDPQNHNYTSFWAGAHHVHYPINDTPQHDYEEKTFKVLWDMSAPGSPTESLFLRIPNTEYFFEERPKPEPLEKMPNFRYLTSDELIPGAVFGTSFTTLTIDTPLYIRYLFSKFQEQGGRVLRGSVTHLYSLLEGGTAVVAEDDSKSPTEITNTTKPDAVIVCVGLGARFLGGVEDKDMFPIRGQTVLVKAPWLKFGMRETKDSVCRTTYIIPRASGDVLIGGTFEIDDWYPFPRPETAEDILRRAFTLCPELAPPKAQSDDTTAPTLDDVRPLIVEHGCGLRPARKQGVRVELEWIEGTKVNRDGRVPVVHNYGHGGFGFQSSWACAFKVLEILDNAFE